MIDKVLVIGAGPGGLASAYYLERAGIPYEVVDRAHIIGSTWASLYPSLTLNTTRYFSHMPDKPFPRSYGVFPTGKQYHNYLVEFAEEHDFNIRLGVDVYSVTPEKHGYRVETSEGTAWYANVIIATGRFNHPYTAHVPELDDYQGVMIHAHDYKGPEQFAGKQILVVGNGPSGLDISIESGERNAPEHPTLLSMRTGLKLKRRYPLGVSKHMWVILAERLPEKMGIKLVDWIESLGFPEGMQKKIRVPTPEMMSSAAGTRGPELIQAVENNEVICVSEPKASDGHRVLVEHLDGVERWHNIDVIILATGYKPALSFLSDEIQFDVDREHWPVRYSSLDYDNPQHLTYGLHRKWDEEKGLTRREIKGYPGLYIVGTFYQGKGAMHNFNIDAELIAHQIKQRTEHLKRNLESGEFTKDFSGI